ncbi:MAG TPA: sigma factor-like helix-turn-helix DNA-binding protein, partial [Acidimicrobiia bacterium]|nr:sigma factor-like helix-turn-helix DNA-binding protein [Acidimicrobiia bacterium]
MRTAIGAGVSDGAEEFVEFVHAAEPKLRQALAALCGVEDARDAVADGLAYAWQHWSRVRDMANPAGYVYRVARSRTRQRRRRVVFPDAAEGVPDVEPGLGAALARLPDRQRVAVLLVHGWDWSHDDVAELMGVSVSTVRNHLRRGLERLR